MGRTQSPEGRGLAPYCSSVGLQGKAIAFRYGVCLTLRLARQRRGENQLIAGLYCRVLGVVQDYSYGSLYSDYIQPNELNAK